MSETPKWRLTSDQEAMLRRIVRSSPELSDKDVNEIRRGLSEGRISAIAMDPLRTETFDKWLQNWKESRNEQNG